MNAKPLFTQEGTQILPHLCGVCNRIWESIGSAEHCCTCGYCGLECNWTQGGVAHTVCLQLKRLQMEDERLAKAELVTDYEGPFLSGDCLYETLDDLMEHLEISDRPIPEFVLCAERVPVYLDSEEVAGLLENDHCEATMESLYGEAELSVAIEAFNTANQSNCSYTEDRTRKVRVPAASL